MLCICGVFQYIVNIIFAGTKITHFIQNVYNQKSRGRIRPIIMRLQKAFKYSCRLRNNGSFSEKFCRQRAESITSCSCLLPPNALHFSMLKLYNLAFVRTSYVYPPLGSFPALFYSPLKSKKMNAKFAAGILALGMLWAGCQKELSENTSDSAAGKASPTRVSGLTSTNDCSTPYIVTLESRTNNGNGTWTWTWSIQTPIPATAPMAR